VTCVAALVGDHELPLDVALLAGQCAVRSAERERGARVIKGGDAPVGDLVARGAVVGQLAGRVIGCERVVVVFHVAGVAIYGCTAELTGYMALLARHAPVGPFKGEIGALVIEGGRGPRVYRVAIGTDARYLRRGVTRQSTRLVVVEMAVTAAGIGLREVALHMALVASSLGVRALQQESGLRMFEGSRLPALSIVALLTLARKESAGVIGNSGLIEIFRVTRIAVRGSALESVAGVALLAAQRTVAGRRRVTAIRMLESGRLPGGNRVAKETVMGQPARNMIRSQRRGVTVLMTGVTIPRQTGVLA
jgi:hypothetical protein